MKRKLFTSIILSVFFLLILTGTVHSASERNLSEFEKCKNFGTDNNSVGSFAYGCDYTTLYSACILPNFSTRYVKVDGIIRSISHTLDSSCALYEKSNKYYITQLNTVNGNYCTYSFGSLEYIENSSFAFCNNKAYFIMTDSAYTYVRSYYSNGSFCRKYTFGENIKRLITNDSNVYAQSYSGNLYKLSESNQKYITNISPSLGLCNAGSSYIFSESGKLFSLNDNTFENISGARLNCIVRHNRRTVYSKGQTVFCNGNQIRTENTIRSLHFFGNKVSILDNNFTLKSYNISDFEKATEKATVRQNENSLINPLTNTKDSVIKIKSGTTVASFKKQISANAKVYDKSGNEVTKGLIKTLYKAKINGVFYEIAVSGDITGEGNVKSNDVSALMSHFVETSELGGVLLKSADFNDDGIINNKDLVEIARQAEKR